MAQNNDTLIEESVTSIEMEPEETVETSAEMGVTDGANDLKNNGHDEEMATDTPDEDVKPKCEIEMKKMKMQIESADSEADLEEISAQMDPTLSEELEKLTLVEPGPVPDEDITILEKESVISDGDTTETVAEIVTETVDDQQKSEEPEDLVQPGGGEMVTDGSGDPSEEPVELIKEEVEESSVEMVDEPSTPSEDLPTQSEEEETGKDSTVEPEETPEEDIFAIQPESANQEIKPTRPKSGDTITTATNEETNIPEEHIDTVANILVNGEEETTKASAEVDHPEKEPNLTDEVIQPIQDESITTVAFQPEDTVTTIIATDEPSDTPEGVQSVNQDAEIKENYPHVVNRQEESPPPEPVEKDQEQTAELGNVLDPVHKTVDPEGEAEPGTADEPDAPPSEKQPTQLEGEETGKHQTVEPDDPLEENIAANRPESAKEEIEPGPADTIDLSDESTDPERTPTPPENVDTIAMVTDEETGSPEGLAYTAEVETVSNKETTNVSADMDHTERESELTEEVTKKSDLPEDGVKPLQIELVNTGADIEEVSTQMDPTLSEELAQYGGKDIQKLAVVKTEPLLDEDITILEKESVTSDGDTVETVTETVNDQQKSGELEDFAQSGGGEGVTVATAESGGPTEELDEVIKEEDVEENSVEISKDLPTQPEEEESERDSAVKPGDMPEKNILAIQPESGNHEVETGPADIIDPADESSDPEKTPIRRSDTIDMATDEQNDISEEYNGLIDDGKQDRLGLGTPNRESEENHGLEDTTATGTIGEQVDRSVLNHSGLENSDGTAGKDFFEDWIADEKFPDELSLLEVNPMKTFDKNTASKETHSNNVIWEEDFGDNEIMSSDLLDGSIMQPLLTDSKPSEQDEENMEDYARHEKSINTTEEEEIHRNQVQVNAEEDPSKGNSINESPRSRELHSDGSEPCSEVAADGPTTVEPAYEGKANAEDSLEAELETAGSILSDGPVEVLALKIDGASSEDLEYANGSADEPSSELLLHDDPFEKDRIRYTTSEESTLDFQAVLDHRKSTRDPEKLTTAHEEQGDSSDSMVFDQTLGQELVGHYSKLEQSTVMDTDTPPVRPASPRTSTNNEGEFLIEESPSGSTSMKEYLKRLPVVETGDEDNESNKNSLETVVDSFAVGDSLANKTGGAPPNNESVMEAPIVEYIGEDVLPEEHVLENDVHDNGNKELTIVKKDLHPKLSKRKSKNSVLDSRRLSFTEFKDEVPQHKNEDFDLANSTALGFERLAVEGSAVLHQPSYDSKEQKGQAEQGDRSDCEQIEPDLDESPSQHLAEVTKTMTEDTHLDVYNREPEVQAHNSLELDTEDLNEPESTPRYFTEVPYEENVSNEGSDLKGNSWDHHTKEIGIKESTADYLRHVPKPETEEHDLNLHNTELDIEDFHERESTPRSLAEPNNSKKVLHEDNDLKRNSWDRNTKEVDSEESTADYLREVSNPNTVQHDLDLYSREQVVLEHNSWEADTEDCGERETIPEVFAELPGSKNVIHEDGDLQSISWNTDAKDVSYDEPTAEYLRQVPKNKNEDDGMDLYSREPKVLEHKSLVLDTEDLNERESTPQRLAEISRPKEVLHEGSDFQRNNWDSETEEADFKESTADYLPLVPKSKNENDDRDLFSRDRVVLKHESLGRYAEDLNERESTPEFLGEILSPKEVHHQSSDFKRNNLDSDTGGVDFGESTQDYLPLVTKPKNEDDGMDLDSREPKVLEHKSLVLDTEDLNESESTPEFLREIPGPREVLHEGSDFKRNSWDSDTKEVGFEESTTDYLPPVPQPQNEDHDIDLFSQDPGVLEHKSLGRYNKDLNERESTPKFLAEKPGPKKVLNEGSDFKRHSWDSDTKEVDFEESTADYLRQVPKPKNEDDDLDLFSRDSGVKELMSWELTTADRNESELTPESLAELPSPKEIIHEDDDKQSNSLNSGTKEVDFEESTADYLRQVPKPKNEDDDLDFYSHDRLVLEHKSLELDTEDLNERESALESLVELPRPQVIQEDGSMQSYSWDLAKKEVDFDESKEDYLRQATKPKNKDDELDWYRRDSVVLGHKSSEPDNEDLNERESTPEFLAEGTDPKKLIHEDGDMKSKSWDRSTKDVDFDQSTADYLRQVPEPMTKGDDLDSYSNEPSVQNHNSLELHAENFTERRSKLGSSAEATHQKKVPREDEDLNFGTYSAEVARQRTEDDRNNSNSDRNKKTPGFVESSSSEYLSRVPRFEESSNWGLNNKILASAESMKNLSEVHQHNTEYHDHDLEHEPTSEYRTQVLQDTNESADQPLYDPGTAIQESKTWRRENEELNSNPSASGHHFSGVGRDESNDLDFYRTRSRTVESHTLDRDKRELGNGDPVFEYLPEVPRYRNEDGDYGANRWDHSKSEPDFEVSSSDNRRKLPTPEVDLGLYTTEPKFRESNRWDTNDEKLPFGESTSNYLGQQPEERRSLDLHNKRIDE